MKIPRFILCAGASNSGKTVITCGIMQALKDKGLKITSFKCGPDYIDPMFHSKVLGAKGRNLDSFFMGKEGTVDRLVHHSMDSDITVIEGVMGYYDGMAGFSTSASTYDIARITKTPAILIVNAKGMSLSTVAYIKGFMEFAEDSQIKGVILNRVSPMIYPRLKNVIEETLNVKVIGYVPELKDFTLESRHLGLVMPQEVKELEDSIKKLADILKDTIDIDMLLELAGEAEDLEPIDKAAGNEPIYKELKIAMSRDEAFCFMYRDNIEFLEAQGAEIAYFSPIRDKALPENVSGLILWGGYPELYLEQLSENKSLIEEIRQKHSEGMPIMAECGGFMYLHKNIEDMKGKIHSGVGIIDGTAYNTKKLGNFGYIGVQQNGEGFIENMAKDERLLAHEFHYFNSTAAGTDCIAEKPISEKKWNCMHSKDNLFAGFPHYYYYGSQKLPLAFLDKCLKYEGKRRC